MATSGYSRHRRSWPFASSRRLWFGADKSFEAEDAPDIPDVFHADSTSELKDPERVSLHRRLRDCGRLGLSPRVGLDGICTFGGRLQSFTDPWTGPQPFHCAECGLVKVTGVLDTTNWAQCYCCTMTFRNLTPDVCVWTLHRQLSPNCLHLRKRTHAHLFKEQGIARRLVRRLSCDVDSDER